MPVVKKVARVLPSAVRMRSVYGPGPSSNVRATQRATRQSTFPGTAGAVASGPSRSSGGVVGRADSTARWAARPKSDSSGVASFLGIAVATRPRAPGPIS